MLRKRLLLALCPLVLAVGAGAMFFLRQDPGAGMTAAAQQFVSSLTDEQRTMAVLPIDSPERLEWHFIPKDSRKGLQVKHMSPEQRQLAEALLRAALSQVGYDKATTIMALESILHELEQNRGRFARDPQRYYFTIFGEPRPDARWGLSVEGHHLSLNFVVESRKVLAHSPAFFGANPATVTVDVPVGPPRGTRVLAKEELLAFELLASLTDEQRPTAIIAPEAPADLRAPGEPHPPADAAEGIAARDLNADQKRLLRELVNVYTDNMPPTVAAARWSEIEAASFDNVHFAWAGATEPGIGHYYRVQGPTFVIELVNTQPDSAGNPANHIHSVWRNMQGDFGVSR